MPTLDIVCPYLLEPVSERTGLSVQAPSIARLLARADRLPDADRDPFATLMCAAGVECSSADVEAPTAAVALLGATYEAVPIPEGDDAPTSWRAPLASSWRLASPRPGTIPLYVHATASPQPAGMLSGVLVAIGRPGFDLELVPDCGCDACDWGSDGLLEQVDELIAAVLAGDLRAAKGADRQHEWRTLDLPGHSSSGTSRSRDWRRRPWSERWEGAPWL